MDGKAGAIPTGKERGRMSEIKLKPCPFCGGEAEILNVDDRYTAKCRSCFCGTGEYKDPERASETWNRRADNETD